MTPECVERQQLENELMVAAHQHMLLDEAANAVLSAQLQEVKEDAERAKAAWELAARALQQHRSQHRC